jgi:membrane-bound lytic murein transglycosylase A
MVHHTMPTKISKAASASRISKVMALILSATLVACTTAPQSPPPPSAPPAAAPAPKTISTELGTLTQVSFSALPGWASEDFADFWAAWQQNCRAAAPRLVAAKMTGVCQSSKALGAEPVPEVLRAFVEANFTPYAITSAEGKDEGLMTGYYEPVLAGSRTPTAQFKVPLWAVPADLVSQPVGEANRARKLPTGLVPYTRAELARTPPRALVYVEDAVEAAFLQIQGSGRVTLGDTTVRMAFADHNGLPYKSMGRYLIERGEMRANEVSMQGIKAWARRNPQRLDELLGANPRVIFFKEEAIPDGRVGPNGALSVPLTAKRSVAVDPRSAALSSLLWLSSTEPLSTKPLRTLVFAQDVGTAITGAVRADFYWGTGVAAGEQAGRTRQSLKLYVLMPQ